MLRTSIAVDSGKELHFNSAYMAAFKQTNCYREWLDQFGSGGIELKESPLFRQIAVAHPFSGTLSVQDVKLKFAQ